jgi:hypothetical protein
MSELSVLILDDCGCWGVLDEFGMKNEQQYNRLPIAINDIGNDFIYYLIKVWLAQKAIVS